MTFQQMLAARLDKDAARLAQVALAANDLAHSSTTRNRDSAFKRKLSASQRLIELRYAVLTEVLLSGTPARLYVGITFSQAIGAGRVHCPWQELGPVARDILLAQAAAIGPATYRSLCSATASQRAAAVAAIEDRSFGEYRAAA